MERRKFLTTGSVAAAATAGLAAASSLPAPAIAQRKRRLKMTLAFPKGFPGYGDYAANVAKRIETLTDDRFSIRLYGAGELVGYAEGVDAVGKGIVDMFYASPYVFQAKSRAFNFFTTIPFGMTTDEYYAWMMHGGGEQLADELFGKFGVKHFMCGQSHMQWGGWFNKEIKSVDDVRGLKIRITGLGGEVYKRLGASPVIMSVRETQPAFASGVVDAVEQANPWVDQIIGYQKLAKYYYFPGWQEPTTPSSLGINLKLWNSFTNKEQEQLQWAIEAGLWRNYSRHLATIAQQIERLRREHPKIKILPLPDSVLEAFGKETFKLYAELSASDPEFKKVWDSYYPFLKRIAAYSGHTDLPFMRVREKVLV